ncbi:MAG TPA: ion transporter [Rudaea sp.]|nr:ion transporter [Rudaea sp.]HSC09789.1 ion transporter [Rhodanobacteraceae bacterium]
MPTPASLSAPPSPASAAQSEFAARYGRPEGALRLWLYTIIVESDTAAGRLFDLVLIVLILASVVVVILDSVQSLTAAHDELFNVLEWSFTILFTIEYVLRLVCVRRPLRYATSFFGLVDVLAVLPTYLAFFVPAAAALINVRLLRLLRIFRILKLNAYVKEFAYLGEALVASRRKITVFIGFVLVVVAVLGSVMYVVEGPENGFTSIPVAMYWGISTLTTVGFGDITPKTDLGRFIASWMMLLGWGILAVPTGIVTAEMTARSIGRRESVLKCDGCQTEGHDPDARFCKQCGRALNAPV